MRPRRSPPATWPAGPTRTAPEHPRQVFENTESTTRQYALRERAIALGWPPEHIVIVDSDLGQSAASATDRAGFQTLVAEVGLGHVGIVLGHVGIVLGLEVSRLVSVHVGV